LYDIASQTSLTIDFGGGIKTGEDVRSVLDNGAQMINVGSIAYKNKDLLLDWAATYGWDKIFLGADVKDHKIMVNGWQEQTDRDIIDHLQPFYANGMRQFFCTDVSRDGMLQGPGIELYKQILAVYPDIQLTASGGVSTLADIDSLATSGCVGVIVGKALYEGRIQIADLKKYNN
jgi:phosphoribosylformimino-5-aminoimidazole carboxamide ribotide isomerase